MSGVAALSVTAISLPGDAYRVTASARGGNAVDSYTLAVSKAGNGTITSQPPGITCGADCTQSYLYGSMVTLTATADSGSTFAGWSGACSGSGTCSLTMTAPRQVTATFTGGYAIYLPLVRRDGDSQ